MSYRDELSAAHARIQMLERELANAGDQRIDGVTAERDTLKIQLGEARARLVHLQNEQAPADGSLPTLSKHNRSFPPIAGGRGAGVLCERCLVTGQHVELVLDPP